MSCEEELNALRRAEQELARFQQERSEAGAAMSDAETMQRMAQLTSALRDKQDAYNQCRGRIESVAELEALMRDASGMPLGGGAGPPM